MWQFGDGSSVPGPHSIVGTNDAERFGELTMISGTGIPPSPPPAIATTGNGFDELNGTYDAKVIGDFTGLTPPPGKHDKD